MLFRNQSELAESPRPMSDTKKLASPSRVFIASSVPGTDLIQNRSKDCDASSAHQGSQPRYLIFSHTILFEEMGEKPELSQADVILRPHNHYL